jgi:predicted HTH transcriptional regulator
VWYKPAGQITEADLNSLISAQAAEDERLEFKRDMYGPDADDTREMIRDITGFANHRGGLIMIGVEEDGDGIAVRVPRSGC